jgi:alpha-galactosidase
VQRVNKIKLHEPIPCGWCSWDAFGWIMHEKDLYATLDLIEKQRLVDYGFNTFQIDDGWQCGWRCSGDWRPNPNRFPGGIRPIADRAARMGLTLGLWLGPFSDEDRKSSAGPGGQLNATAPSWMKAAQPVLDNHPEWMTVQGGQPTGNYDISHPDFLRHLTSLMDTFTNQWRVGYVKADFLAWGYGVQHDTSKPHHDIYRNALRAMRNGMKPGTYFMTCISHEWKSLGIADAQRIGNDVSGVWKGIEPTIRCAGPLYFTNGRIWWADPDQLHVGGQVDQAGKLHGLTLDQARAWAALIALYGSVTLTGDRLDRLDADRLKLLTQCLPSTGRTARPVDLFDVLSGRDPPRHSSVWHLPAVKPFGRWDVVGVFNWTNDPARRTVDLLRLGLDPDDKYLIWDYWAKQPVHHKVGDKTIELDVASTSSRLLVIHKDDGRPRFISSDRHLTAGLIDVDEVKWNAATRQLSGRSSHLVKDARFEYVFHLPPPLGIARAQFGATEGQVRSLGDGFYVVQLTALAARVDWDLALSQP